MLGPELLKNMETIVKHVQQNLKASQGKKKSYADLKRTPREFQVGEHVYIKVKPNKIFVRLPAYIQNWHPGIVFHLEFWQK